MRAISSIFRQFIIQLSLIILIGLFSNAHCQELMKLNLSKAIEAKEHITTKDFIESLTYIPLATSPDNLVDANPKVYVTKDFVLIITIERCQLFDRRNGEFIREIGRKGRGPGEYYATRGFFNESTRSYYFVGLKGDLIKYTLDGIFRGSLKIPEYNDSFANPSFPDVYSYINDTTLVCNFTYSSGTENKILMTFTESGRSIKNFPNYNALDKQNNFVFSTGESNFHRFNNMLYYQNRFNDTVFRITQDQMVPSFIISGGKYRPPFESRWWPSEKREQAGYIIQSDIYESTRFIAFHIYNYSGEERYFALYDKSLRALKVTDYSSGIENTTDGFTNFKTGSMNESGELSFVVQPSEIQEWIRQYPEKFKSLKPELQKLKDIKLEDNPVVVIAKMKK